MQRHHLAFLLAAVTLLWALAVGASHAQESGGPPAFAIEALNPGLDSPNGRLDRSTPQATLEAFFTTVSRGDFKSAAHILDLDAIPRDEQAREGPVLARKLAEIIERKVPIDFEAIPDRPDGMETRGTSREPMVGEPRKSLELGSIDLGPWPVAIRLNRVRAGDADPVWVFSRQTVEHIDALYREYGPTRLERALPDGLRTEAFGGLMWWEVIALPVMLALTAGVATFTYRLISLVTRKIPPESVREAIGRSRLPVVLIVASIFLQSLVMGIFVFSAGVYATLSLIFWLLIVAALVMAASRVLDTIIDYTSDRYLDTIDKPENTSDRDWYTNLSAVKRVGVLAVVIIGVAMALSSLNIFSDFGMSLLVSAGVATAVLGIAAQTMIGNVLASLQLAVAKPLRIGDAVYYEGHWAYVEQINYTYVQLRTWDQKRFMVPVRNFVATAFENWTMADPQLIMPVLLKLDHGTDVEALRQHFAEIVKEDPDWTEDAEPKVQVIDQDEDGIDVRFYCTADDPTSAWNLHCRVREKLIAFVRDSEAEDAVPRTRIERLRTDESAEERDEDTIPAAAQ